MGAPSRICPLHHQVHRRPPSPSSSYRGRGSPREGRHDSRHRTSDPVRTSDIEGHEGGNQRQKLCIGRRTSYRQRTSEIPMTESLQIPRTSGGLRTSDTSDVRNPTGVRHPLLQIARPLPDPTDTTTFGRPTHIGRPTSAKFGRPNPVGRPKPACAQRQLGDGPCIPLLSPRPKALVPFLRIRVSYDSTQT